MTRPTAFVDRDGTINEKAPEGGYVTAPQGFRFLPGAEDAIRLLDEGFATREDIDASIELGLNNPLGPLRLADLIGLDTVLQIAETLHREFRDPRYAPPPLLRRMVAAGRLGRKSGGGFYED